MPDNPPAALPGPPSSANTRRAPLPGHRVIALTGRDAVAFAQAQTMNDVAALADGHWHWNGWLSPKGRVLALFALLRLSPESLWLVVADTDAAALAAALARYVFRSKVAIAVREDLHVAGAFASPAQARGDTIATDGDTVELDMGGDGGPRMLRITSVDGTEPVDPAADAFAQAWAAFDLAHGWPRLATGQFDAWTPQQLSLDRLQAYSVRKGCYPGQEIVARTHFLGKAKRGLVRMRCARTLEPADVVGSDARPIGRVVAMAGDEGLAVVPLDAEGPYTVDGVACEALPLLGGLQR